MLWTVTLLVLAKQHFLDVTTHDISCLDRILTENQSYIDYEQIMGVITGGEIMRFNFPPPPIVRIFFFFITNSFYIYKEECEYLLCHLYSPYKFIFVSTTPRL